MENKNISVKFRAVCSIVAISLFFSAEAVETDVSSKTKMTLKADILKKYGKTLPTEVLQLKDELSGTEKVQIDNNYFKISYPKCISVEPTIIDSSDINIKTSASLTFKRNEKCRSYDKKNDNILLFSSFGDRKFKNLQSATAEIGVLYRQKVVVNDAQGLLFATLQESYMNEEIGNELWIRWGVYFLCQGKKDQVFKAQFSYPKGNSEVIPFLEKKQFVIPEDYKQVIASFSCEGKPK